MRKHCSPGCKAADHAYKGQRPAIATCVLCKSDFSLQSRDDGGRLRRTDTLFCPDCGRDSPDAQRYKRYGVTPGRYAAAMKVGCQLCLRTNVVLHVDHDHICCATDKGCCGKCVRGFICGPCNRGLGLFFDNPGALRRAADYLESPP